MKKVIIIPARLDSSRLPKKVLLDLKGKTVIQRVYEQCLKVKNVDGVYIATDSIEIKEVCETFTNNVIITKSTHKSGTDRIGEAVSAIDCDIVINVQGDEPFIQPDQIDELCSILNEKIELATLIKKIEKIDELFDKNKPNEIVVDQEAIEQQKQEDAETLEELEDIEIED